MTSLEYIINKYKDVIDFTRKPPYELPITRDDLASLFEELALLRGVEIGVERGRFSQTLLERNKSLNLTGVDPLMVYKGYREHVSQDKMNDFVKEIEERTKGYNYSLIRSYSTEAVDMFKDESLGFVYIDGNHDFLNTTLDIHYWTPKVYKGGIISGHDFVRNKKKDYKCHVKDVVTAWAYSHDIKFWFITKKDKSPSWFWVKE